VGRAALLLPAAAALLLLGRLAGVLLLGSVALTALALLAVLALAALLHETWRARRGDELLGAAAAVDRSHSLADLLKTAKPFAQRTASDDGADPALRRGMRSLVLQRAESTASDLAPRRVAPLAPPRTLLWSLPLLLLAALVPLPEPSGSRGSVLLASRGEATAEDETSGEAAQRQRTTDERASDIAEEPTQLQDLGELRQLDPRLAALLAADRSTLDADALAQLEQFEGELSPEALARLEELAEELGARLGEAPEGSPQGDDATPQAARGAFEELARDAAMGEAGEAGDEGADERRGADPEHGKGQSAPPGDQMAAGAERESGEREPSDDVQPIELPPTGAAQLRQAKAGATDQRMRGDGMQMAGEQAGEQSGEQRPGAGGGDSSGPQSGDFQLYGDEAGAESPVTLELTLLKAREELAEREQRPERRWRASRQESAEAPVERLPEGDWSRPDEQRQHQQVPRHHREALRQYFTPQPKEKDRQRDDS
ncbi:MAG: hypothetical protein DWQ30_17470, partial [Acidobacteria bacterium]